MWLKNLWRRRGSFTLVVREPFGGPVVKKKLPCTGESLFSYLAASGQWKSVRTAKVNGEDVKSWWPYTVPKPGDEITIDPGTGLKNFTEGFITRLNAETQGGKFLKAAILTESYSPLTYKFFIDHDQEIVFDGNTYTPLSMSWQDFEISQEMNLPTMKVTVPNIGGEVVDYVEEINILENDVVLQLLHVDLLNDVSAKDELMLQIQMIEGDDLVAQFTLGLNLGFQDTLPRKVVLKSEFPGLTETYARFRG